MLLLCALISVLIIELVRCSSFHIPGIFKPLLDTKLAYQIRSGEFISDATSVELPHL
jgi:hypothetical protein